MSLYVLAPGGIVEKYPYTITDIRRDNPAISFPQEIPNEMAAEYGVFSVTEIEQPPFDAATQEIVWINPVFEDGHWLQQWAVRDLTPEEIAARLEAKRASMVITPFQGKAALFQAGLLDDVEALIAGDADTLTKLAWQNALEWRRTSPMIASLSAALGMTDVQVDDLFKAAAAIVV